MGSGRDWPGRGARRWREAARAGPLRPWGGGAAASRPRFSPGPSGSPGGAAPRPVHPGGLPQPSAARSRLAAPSLLVQWRRRSPQRGRAGAGQRRPLSRGARARLGAAANQRAAYMRRVGGPAESGAAIGWARRGERFESAAAAGAERGPGDGAVPGHPGDNPRTPPQVCAGVRVRVYV